MKNWKRFGRKCSWPNQELFQQNYPGGTEENHKNSLSGQLVFHLIFEPAHFKEKSRALQNVQCKHIK
jgi:hypothetical protein